jgi:mannosyltransferase OCH1-like enzyme
MLVGRPRGSKVGWTVVISRFLSLRSKSPARQLARYRNAGPSIPAIFHQVWLGPDPLPEEFARYRESWRRAHPAWELRLWGEDDLPADLRTAAVYERQRRPVERADILRLEVLWKFGGVYLDLDMECLRPIDGLVEGLDFLGTEIKPGRITNTVIGAAPEHPILDRALTELRPHELGTRFDKRLSGPLFLDSVVRQYPGIATLPPELFYPMTDNERADAYAIHHAARTWKDVEDWKEVTLLLEERLARALRELDEEREAHDRTKRALEELRGTRSRASRVPSSQGRN